MRTIQTILDVATNGEATLKLPSEVTPGRHNAIVLISEAHPTPAGEADWDLPVHDLGPWPDELSLSRECLYGDDGR